MSLSWDFGDGNTSFDENPQTLIILWNLTEFIFTNMCVDTVTLKLW